MKTGQEDIVKSSLIREKFENACRYFEDESLDLIHIDGLHTYEAVKNDYEMWGGKLKSTVQYFSMTLMSEKRILVSTTLGRN